MSRRLVCGTIAVAMLSAACDREPPRTPPALSVVGSLSEVADEGFQRAEAPVPLAFPRDHGSHPGYRNEWWYFTGNLVAAQGRRFGYQFTLFRSAIAPHPRPSPSAWATHQLYLAHLALTDVSDQRFIHSERVARGAVGLAGVETEPVFRAWLEDWTVAGEHGCPGCFRIRAEADGGEVALDLTLRAQKPPALHGDRGLSAKSATPGNASYYYSYTRLEAAGEITVAQRRHRVQGESWFDHEWSTSALEPGQAGWDWFSLQLSDHTEVMLFRLRHRSDPGLDFVSGSLIDRQGQVRRLGPGDFVVHARGQWRSPHSGVTYPSGWSVEVPREQLRLSLLPRMADQEMNVAFRYWEGAVSVNGQRAGRRISGQGYVELTGYE